MTSYATERDLYTFGLRRGVVVNDGRECATVSATTDLLELNGHQLETGDRVQVRAVAGGTLASPLSATAVYYVIRESDSTFKLSATDGGPAIDLTSDGSTMIVTAELPVDDLLEAYSRFVDDFIPHGVDMDAPYPVTIVRIVSELAAAKLLSLTGQSSVSISEAEIGAKAQLERWVAGLPIRDARVSGSTNRAVVSTLASTSDPRGWTPNGSGRLP